MAKDQGGSVRSDGYCRWFPGDYLRDTDDLSQQEHGAYFLLLNSYYAKEFLPSDPDRLYRIAKARTEDEIKATDYVVKTYFRRDGERLFQKRVEREIEARRHYKDEQARKSKLAVTAKKYKPTDGPGGEPAGKPAGQPVGEPLASASASASASRSGSASGSGSKIEDQERVVAVAPRTRTGKFTPPTLAEVSAYCAERGNSISPQNFVDKNTAIGWVVGKNRSPMRDWKAVIRTWEHNEEERNGGRNTGGNLGSGEDKPPIPGKYDGLSEVVDLGAGRGYAAGT